MGTSKGSPGGFVFSAGKLNSLDYNLSNALELIELPLPRHFVSQEKNLVFCVLFLR